MVRTQLYLPENLYDIAKKEARETKTSFADIVRLSLEMMLVQKQTMNMEELKKRFPIFKFAGIVKGSSGEVDNDNIDDFLYGTEQAK
ncbi:MAG: CopG family transcriptional regulator [Patescibacteria group bacterium]